MAKEPSCYETHDYVLASALYAAGAVMDEIRREAPSERFRHGRAVFVFTNATDAEEKVSLYFCGKLMVEAKTFTSTLNDYRKLVYSKENLGSPK